MSSITQSCPISSAIAVGVTLIYAALSLLHGYWAVGGHGGKAAVVPEVSGRPTFVPSKSSTVAVAVMLALCALLVAATAKLVAVPISATWLRWLCVALAVIMAARAVGDFRLVGFFKRVRGTRFARLDTMLFAPLCLLLAAGVLYVGLC